MLTRPLRPSLPASHLPRLLAPAPALALDTHGRSPAHLSLRFLHPLLRRPARLLPSPLPSPSRPAEARWFTRAELLAVLNHNEGTKLTRADQKELAAAAENSNPHNEAPDKAGAAAKAASATAAAPPPDGSPQFKVPPLTAIGGVILNEWAHGRAGRQPVAAMPPANL